MDMSTFYPQPMIGKRVLFKAPALHGQMTLSGIVKRVMFDGRLEVKTQSHGYWNLRHDEIFYDHNANKQD